jgi:CRISPR-associated endoribonuclease Cas6
VIFRLLACQYQLASRGVLRFPPLMAGNVLRGALGIALRDAAPEDYERLFEPRRDGKGPSGLSDSPRPFVIRTAALNGRQVQPGERFCFGLHLFDTSLDHFTRAFAAWADVVSVEHREIAVDLSPHADPVSRIRVEFLTPTDLKSAAFPLLLARARDRVSTLRSLYGEGPLDIDFRGLGERARSITTSRSELRRLSAQRRSSRTGQRHDIGGLVGFAEYVGDLAEFLPYLEAASWTGIGRHCTWGNGHINTSILNSEF